MVGMEGVVGGVQLCFCGWQDMLQKQVGSSKVGVQCGILCGTAVQYSTGQSQLRPDGWEGGQEREGRTKETGACSPPPPQSPSPRYSGGGSLLLGHAQRYDDANF